MIGTLSNGKVLGVVLLSFAGFLIYLPSELGVALSVPPDSSEYSICLANLFEYGRFGFTLNGEWYPSRYTPFFSLLCLTPAYLLSGCNVLCIHWSIMLFALALLAAVWKIGLLCGLKKLAILPPILLMFMPDFLFYSRVAMTEVPYAALVSALALVFVRFVNQRQPSIRMCVGIGLLVSWAGLVRFTGFTIIIPFVVVVMFRQKEWRIRIKHVCSLSLPIVIAMVIGLTYNYVVFDSPFRNGYNYWLALPFDYPNLTFNIKYVASVVPGYLMFPIMQFTLFLILIILLATLHIVRKKAYKDFIPFLMMEGFVMVHAFVLLFLYAGYYTIDTRFFLSITVLVVPLFFAATNIILADCRARFKTFIQILIFVGSVQVVLLSSNLYSDLPTPRSMWLAESRISASILPAGAIVIQQGDPNVVDYFGYNSKGLILYPRKRRVIYVNDMISPNNISPVCQSPNVDVRWPTRTQSSSIVPECIKSGTSRLPFPSTFEEDPLKVKSYIDNGKRVFMMKSSFLGGDFAFFKSDVERMGLAVKQFGTIETPRVSFNQIRHLYDKIVFQGKSMDWRPESVVVLYEIVRPGGV